MNRKTKRLAFLLIAVAESFERKALALMQRARRMERKENLANLDGVKEKSNG